MPISEEEFSSVLVSDMLGTMKSSINVQHKGKQVTTWDWAESVYESRITVRIYIVSSKGEVTVETARCTDGSPPPSTLDGWKTRKGILRQSWTIPHTMWVGGWDRLSTAVVNVIKFAERNSPPPAVDRDAVPLPSPHMERGVAKYKTRKLNLGDP